MEENFNNNQQPTMQEPKKQKQDVKTKKKKTKVAIITLSTIVVLFLGLQVYASVNGYGNVFFMIKNLITTGNPAGNQEIFSDKDITLSYKSIELAEGLKIQANRLEIKDGKTKMYLSVKSENMQPLPLKYEISTTDNSGKQIKDKTAIIGIIPEADDDISYEEILTLDYEVGDNDIIVLKIKDTSDKELRTLEINLQTREITVKGEKEFEKISEIELKRYLGFFSVLNDSRHKESENLIEIAYNLRFNETSRKIGATERDIINETVRGFYGDNAKFETIKNQKGENVEILNGTADIYEKISDVYDMPGNMRIGKCLKIEDISCENEIYTVKYIYIVATGEEASEDKLEELPQYETTIKLKRDENNLYSKYQIVTIEKGTEVKNKVSADVNEEENNNQELDYNHDKHYYTVVEHSGTKGNDGRHTTLNGTHIEKCTVCNEERRVPHNFGKWFKLKNSSGEVNAYTLWCNDCKDYIYTSDYNIVKNSGYGINEEENTANTINMTGIEDVNSISDEIKEKLTNPEKWVLYTYGDCWNMKMPYTFKIGSNYNYDRYKTQYYEGWMLNRRNTIDWGLEDKAEKVPVTIIHDITISENVYPGSDVANSWLSNNEERMVKSTDNCGWTDWYPLIDYSNVSENGFSRKYGRVKNGQMESIEFQFTTNSGCGTEIYKFMGNVLSSVSAKGLR